MIEGDSVRKGIAASNITISSLTFTNSSEPVSFVTPFASTELKNDA